MDTYFVKGMDRNTGEPRSITPEAASERAAMDAAYAAGMVVESIRKLPKTQVIGESRVLAPTQKPERSSRVPGFFDISFPFIGRRKNYEDRGVNTVGEIAAGVFVGLLLFSCVSPIIFVVIMGVYWGYLQGVRGSP